MPEELYTSGRYLQLNPTWHVEESSWKAKHVYRMLARNRLAPTTICEVGCGAGEVLRQLQMRMPENCMFWGYDISPQAIALAEGRANERLQFVLADVRQEDTRLFDLILVLDVIEHLEDYLSFLRGIRLKGQYKVFHIPLDLSAQTVLRTRGLSSVRKTYGHLHYFTKETALLALQDAGYDILDHCYTPRAIEEPTHEVKRELLKLPRKFLFSIHNDFAAHLLGGWSLLVLAR
ncbi:MAG TPA: class I SAM-dependent methyltransferase [Ktedonobacteraceae bacterium]|nr:class I SAM-dependent methyltransferase [Ktedonobacteraceae bacterium]